MHKPQCIIAALNRSQKRSPNTRSICPFAEKSGENVNSLVSSIDNPTTERLLQAFRDITLTIVNLPGQRIRHVTPLTALQVRILELLGLSPAVYTALVEN